MSDGEKTTTSAVVICTRHRPSELRSALRAVFQTRPTATVVVLDGSTDEATRDVCASLGKTLDGAGLHYVRAQTPGLTRQRNQAVSYCDGLGSEILHFIDDDTEVLPGYFDAIESRFLRDSQLVGVGACIENFPQLKYPLFRRVFDLTGKTPGKVLRSGRWVVAQYPGISEDIVPDCLAGCCMSYLTETCRQYRFDERLEGASLGEDRDFGFRVSRDRSIAIEPTARCVHHVSPVNRLSPYRSRREYAVLTFAWVVEQRQHGLSRLAFVWSLVGEIFLTISSAVVRRRKSSLQAAAGLVVGLIICLSGHANGKSRLSP
jgi:glycosyltransferase involved in cell wall biosynthesis